MKLYDYVVKDSNGNKVSMKEYEGKVLLIINSATGCGLTPQYEGLQNLYDKYKDSGFEILDFPCNQFANQAPGTNEEIHEFCTLKYKTSFPLFSKVDVNGNSEEPLFKCLKGNTKSVFGSNIKWNFTKFLVDRDGRVLNRFAPITKPEKIEAKIEALCKKA